MSTMLRMREGMFGDGNLSAIMRNIPPQLRQEYILALTEGKNVNVGLTRDMMKSAQTEGGWSDFIGRWNDVEAQARDSGLYRRRKAEIRNRGVAPGRSALRDGGKRPSRRSRRNRAARYRAL